MAQAKDECEMNNLIIVHQPAPSKPDTQVIAEAAVKYSTDMKLRQAFEDGARFWLKETSSDGPWWHNLAISVLMVFVIVQFAITLVGVFINSPIRGKWKYVFPLYNEAQSFGEWMSK